MSGWAAAVCGPSERRNGGRGGVAELIMRRFGLLFILLLLAGGTGCSTYYSDYEYSPRPNEMRLLARAQDAAGAGEHDSVLARVLTTVIGVQRPSDATGDRARVHMRILIENLTDQPMTFDGGQSQLTTADLLVLTPIVEPSATIEIAPHGRAEADLYFPLPGSVDDVNLGGLNFSWSVKVNGLEVTRSSTFDRILIYYPPTSTYDFPWM